MVKLNIHVKCVLDFIHNTPNKSVVKIVFDAK